MVAVGCRCRMVLLVRVVMVVVVWGAAQRSRRMRGIYWRIWMPCRGKWMR